MTIDSSLKDAGHKMEQAVTHPGRAVCDPDRPGDPRRAHPRDGRVLRHSRSLNQLASINVPEPCCSRCNRSTRARSARSRRRSNPSDLGITLLERRPGDQAGVPPLTEERRKELVKQVHARAEAGSPSATCAGARRKTWRSLSVRAASRKMTRTGGEGAPEADRPARGGDRRDPGPQGAGAHGGLVAGDKRDGDDLFEDLDKFFAPIERRSRRAASVGARETPSESTWPSSRARRRRPRSRRRAGRDRAGRRCRGRGLVRHDRARDDRRHRRRRGSTGRDRDRRRGRGRRGRDLRRGGGGRRAGQRRDRADAGPGRLFGGGRGRGSRRGRLGRGRGRGGRRGGSGRRRDRADHHDRRADGRRRLAR